MIRNLIREFLLQEEVFGAQAFVYHGSKSPPDILVKALLKNKFKPGEGSGGMYGFGLYAVYDLAKTSTGSGRYGDYLYKLKVNLYGFISFDPDVTKLIYKRDLEPWQQAEEVGADPSTVETLKEYKRNSNVLSSSEALWASKFLKGQVKGIVYTGSNDGRCILAYDASIAVPVAWKKVKDSSWTPIDRELIKPALRHSSTGEWEQNKYELTLFAMINKLSKLPIDQRVWDGDLHLAESDVKSLPEGLKVKGDLSLYYAKIKSLPNGLEVKRILNIAHTQITSLPAGLKVGESLILDHTRISSLPEGLKVRGNLYASVTSIESLPDGLEVEKNADFSFNLIKSLPSGLKIGYDLILNNTEVAYLPSDLQVGGHLDISKTQIKSLPPDFKVNGNFDISNTQIKSLPIGLRVEGDLYLEGTQITSLPDDLEVGDSIFGFKGDVESVREDLRDKIM